MTINSFSVFWTDPQGTVHTEFKYRPIEDVRSAVTRLTRGPAAMMGIVKEVRVVDVSDCTNFLWQNGEVVFPTAEDLER